MLSEKETVELKKKIISQIDATFPPEQKESAKSQIESMNSEQFESFLEKNNLLKKEGGECVFCSIVSGKIKSCKIEENEDAVAILEINPISEGHTIIIPKEHTDKIPDKVNKFAEKISKKIQEELNPKRVEIFQTSMFGHQIVNILPVYKDETQESERKSARTEDLERVKSKIEKEAIEKPKIQEIKEFFRLPKRIP